MLTSTTTTMFRPSVARSCGLQPLLRRSTPTACPYSTFRPSSLGLRQSPWQQKQTPCIKPIRSSTTTTTVVPRRHASTTSAAQQDAEAAAAASAQARASHPDLPPLDWNTFFQLRKTRRRWQLAFSFAACATGGTVGALFLSTGAADAMVNQIPLDPFVTLGLMTFGFAALGWLAGPSMGSVVFYALNSKYRAQMTLVSWPWIGWGCLGSLC